MPSSIRRTGSASSPMRLLLALAQIVVRRLEQLGEQLLLRGEVPVEDALADAERGDDVGDRGGVVAPLGEQAGRAASISWARRS